MKLGWRGWLMLWWLQCCDTEMYRIYTPHSLTLLHACCMLAVSEQSTRKKLKKQKVLGCNLIDIY